MREISLKNSDLAEIGSDILSEGGTFQFKAYGSSMYPFIRYGDVLTIHSIDITDLKIGDIVFYKSSDNRLVTHRIVNKNNQDNNVLFITRGDSMMCKDGWIRSEQILGKVISIQRGHKVISLNKGSLNLAAHLLIRFYPLGPIFLKSTEKAKQTASFLLQCLQMFKPYRILARKLIKNKIYYHVATIDSAPELSSFYDFKGFPEIKDPVGKFKKELERMQEEGCFLIARIGKDIAGATVITTFPDDRAYPDWWIFGMSVRTRYRGAGIAEGLVRKAIVVASEKGATTLNLLVFEHNKAAVRLYYKMGFKPVSIPALDILLDEEVRQGQRRRIIMSKDI